jgi:hypothetical protein
MTRGSASVIMEAIMDLRSEIREDLKDLSERLIKIDERLRDVEIAQAITKQVEVKAELDTKWKAGIATSIGAALAALLQALAQKGN